MRDIFLGLEWRFLPDGITDLTKRYNARLEAENLSGEFYWNPETYCFWVRCPDDEESERGELRESGNLVKSEASTKTSNSRKDTPPRSYILFEGCVLEMINEEVGDTGEYGGLFDEDDLIESRKVARIEGEGTTAEQPTQELEWPHEIRFCNHKKVWKAAKGLELRNILSRADFDAIIELSNAILVADLEDNRKIYIGAREEEHAHLAIYTLDNMLRHTIAKSKHVRNVQLFYAEDCEKFQVNLQLFPDVGKKLSQTTMFPHSFSNRYPKIHNCFTVRLCLYHLIRCRYVPVIPDRVVPLSKQDEFLEEYETWRLFRYAAKDDIVNPVTYVPEEPVPEELGGPEPERAGGEGGALLLLEEPTRREKRTKIKQWAIDLPPEASKPASNVEEDARLEALIFNTPRSGAIPQYQVQTATDTPASSNQQSQMPSGVNGPDHGTVKYIQSPRLTAAEIYQQALQAKKNTNASSSFGQPQVTSQVSRSNQATTESSQWPPLVKVTSPAIAGNASINTSSQTTVRQPHAPLKPVLQQPSRHRATQYSQVVANSRGGPPSPNSTNHSPIPQSREPNPSQVRRNTSIAGNSGSARPDRNLSNVNGNQSPSSDQLIHGNPREHKVNMPSLARAPITSPDTSVSIPAETFHHLANPNDDCIELVETFVNPRHQTGTLICEDIPRSFNAAVLQPLKPSSPSSGAVNNENSVEKLAESDETSSRSFHLTMRQKAPRRGRSGKTAQLPRPSDSPSNLTVNPSVSSPTASKKHSTVAENSTDARTSNKELTDDFVKSLNHHLVDTFKIMRTCRGRVALKVEFGRFVISKVQKAMQGSAETPNARSVRDMGAFLANPEVRPDGSAPATYFSPVLTTLPSDIRHLVELEDEGTPMWGNLRNWTVTYIFECLDANDGRFLIEMDAESFKYEIRTLPEVISDINVHCVLRLWDFRFHMAVSEVHCGAEEFAAELFKTLHIEKDQRFPKMSFETAQEHQISVEKVHIRRSCYYEAPTAILEIVEAQRLGVQFIFHDERKTRITRAWSAAPEASHMRKKPLWFEASIFSKIVASTLRENEKLGLGEEARWKTEHLMAQDVGKDLCTLASKITKQIDGMGFYNDNGERPKKDRTTMPTTESVTHSVAGSAAHIQEGFW